MVGDQVQSGDSTGSRRRGFLRTALMVGLAAGSAGLAGWLVRQEADDGSPVVTGILSTSAGRATPPSVATPAGAGGAPSLASPQDESDRLQAEVRYLNAELAGLRAQARSYQEQVAALQATLDSNQSRLGALGGLVALYEQLESLAFDDLLQVGLAEISTTLARTLVHLPLVQAGLVAAAQVLARLEGALPSIQAGLGWLGGVVDQVADTLQQLEDALSETVEPLLPLASKLMAFFEKLLRWVPFGMGERIERGLGGIGAVLTHLPELVHLVGPRLLEPLADWFGNDRDQVVIKTSLIDPIRGQVLAPADELALGVSAIESQVCAMASPVASCLEERRSIRERIAHYREQHGV